MKTIPTEEAVKEKIRELLRGVAEEPDDIGESDTFTTYRAEVLINDILALLSEQVKQAELRAAERISHAAQEAGLVPSELTSAEDWKRAVSEQVAEAKREEGERIRKYIADEKENLKGYGFILTVDEKGNLIAQKDDQITK